MVARSCLLFIFIFFGKGFAMQDHNQTSIIGLDKNEKDYLLKLARTTIIEMLETETLPETRPVSDKVQQKLGVFVTLHKHGDLRGCIGYIEGIKPLYQEIMDMARSAAFRDPRFPPVTPEEVKDLEIEISVLSPLVKVKKFEEVKVGKHGIVIQKGPYRGLLLPQVATDWGWERDEFLKQTCLKAGLPAEAWKEPDTDIYIFSAEIFSEKP